MLHDSVILPSVPHHRTSTFAHYLTHSYPAQSPPLWQDLLLSLQRILIGFVIGVAIGVAIPARPCSPTAPFAPTSSTP